MAVKGKTLKTGKKEKDKEILNNLALVVVLNYIKNMKVQRDFSMPAYFIDELGIEDSKGLIRKLEKKNYIDYIDGNVLCVTSKGEEIFKLYGDYLEFFSLAITGVTIFDYQNMKEKIGAEEPFEKIMIMVILKKINQLVKRDDYIGARNLHYDIGKLYCKLGYSGQAMYHYLASLYFDVSGLKYYDGFLKFISGKMSEKELRNDYEYIYMDTYLLKEIRNAGDAYHDDIVDSVYEKNKISINLLTPEKFKELVKDIIGKKPLEEKWQGYFRAAHNALVNAVSNTKEKNKAFHLAKQ